MLKERDRGRQERDPATVHTPALRRRPRRRPNHWPRALAPCRCCWSAGAETARPTTEPVAIVGASGALGFGLAVRLGRAGVPVVVGSRDAERMAQTVERAREPRSPRARSPGMTTRAPCAPRTP